MSYTQTFFNLQTIIEDYNKSGLKYKIPVMLGVNTFGKNEYADLTELQSILMGGTTGSGKSVFGCALISSLLLRFSPNELKLLLIDMKQVEYPVYNDLPHLLTKCIVDSGESVNWLRKVIDEKKKSKEAKPYIFIVIDTFSDIMVSDFSKEFINLINEITVYGPDLGIYLMMYDSRVGTEVFNHLFISGIKTHICFNTSDEDGSKLLIGSGNGIYLLGKGDMLFQPDRNKEPIRIQGPWISEKEIKQLIDSIKILIHR